jgi:hypothetical protein
MSFYENGAVRIYYEEAGSGMHVSVERTRRADSLGDSSNPFLPPGASVGFCLGDDVAAACHLCTNTQLT